MSASEPKVSCYSGYTYAERPEAFEWHGIEYEIAKVEKSWREPDKRCFQASTRDNKLFNLCYHESRQRWSVSEITRS